VLQFSRNVQMWLVSMTLPMLPYQRLIIQLDQPQTRFSNQRKNWDYCWLLTYDIPYFFHYCVLPTHSTNWPLLSTSRCEVKLHRTWLMTASWLWTPDAPGFAPLTPTSSLFREQTLDLATGVSQSRVWEFGTVYPPHCGSLTLNLDTLNDF